LFFRGATRAGVADPGGVEDVNAAVTEAATEVCPHLLATLPALAAEARALLTEAAGRCAAR
jgi:hypothetical protein